MSGQTHRQTANFIWSICSLLRGPYKRNEYRKVILPLTILRRFDFILEPTRNIRQIFEKLEFGIQINKMNEKNLLFNVIKKFTSDEADTDLRDTENVPLKESIEEYFKREVLPHVPDAWIDHGKTKVGYEIPLNRHFYRYKPPRPLEEIAADVKALESEIVSMLAEITGSAEGLK